MAYVKVCFVVHVFNPHELNLCVDELQQILCMLFLYFFFGFVIVHVYCVFVTTVQCCEGNLKAREPIHSSRLVHRAQQSVTYTGKNRDWLIRASENGPKIAVSTCTYVPYAATLQKKKKLSGPH